MEWISVKDRLPDRNGWYLVCVWEWVTISWFDTNGKDHAWGDFATCEASTELVSHWMPLPEPPKEDAE